MTSLSEAIARHSHDDHYCARCLSVVTARSRACPGCGMPFQGAGRFQRLFGRPPEAPRMAVRRAA